MATGYRNGKTGGNPYQVRDEIRNRDIGGLPGSRKREDDGFFLVKRKGYVNIIDTESLGIEGRRVTDSYIEDDAGCGDGVCYRYYYVVNPNRNKYKVLRRECDGCEIEIIDEGRRCKCAEDKFFETFAPRDEGMENVGTIYNEDLAGYIETDDNIGIEVGEFLFIKGLQQGSSSICGQARLVVAVTKQDNGKYITQLDTPWTSVPTGETFPGAIVQSSNDVGIVPSYIGNDGITTIVNGLLGETICDAGRCLVSAVTHNNQLNYLTEQGFNFFSGVGFDGSFFSLNNSNDVGKDKIDVVSFKNFLVFFGKNKIGINVFNETGEFSFNYDLRTDIGIRNRGAYAVFDNGLFFIGTDNRIYGASINGSGNGIFDLVLEDITKNVFNHIDLVQPGDDVFMGSYSDRLYVFINGKDNENNFATNKSKILIFDKTYGLRLVHEVCSSVISNIKYGEFLGEGVFEYIGYQGDGDIVDGFGEAYEARASAILYKNDNHGITSSDNIPLDMFRRHKLTNAVTLLGQGKYTSDTSIEVERYREYRSSRYYSIDTDNEIIRAWNKGWEREIIEPTECFLEQLTECDNIKNPCIGSTKNYTVNKKTCTEVEERRMYEDYCVCYDDNMYQVSKVHKFNMRFDDGFADYWRVTFKSGGYDVANFGGMIIKTYSEVDFDVDVDDFTSECCSPEIVCKSSC